MKTTLKIATLVLAFAGLSFAAKAQTTSSSASTTTKSGIRYSIGVESGITVGDFKDTHKWNLGGSVQADIPVANQLFVTVNAGYNNFFGAKNDATGLTASDIHLIPVKAGIKYFVVPNFYVQGEAGAAFLLNKDEFYGKTDNGKSVAFVYAPQIGVQFPVSASGNFIDAGIRYEATSKYNTTIANSINSKVQFLGLRLAYGF
ncbi:outer membrane beta-barrel protein [Mucilaginibacter phyllosphaerae]|uniref:Outer membrane protein beta-barrel domain-containing protein n=1 Tax=Mucilaginibacter phyllosphaerae TaxID=1812349 RepID=A0A4Y8A675_9SPHI|nr:outer membrane beta-barrel protein [Mucilaginibacter phyllosphaerae]MBB3971104.1 hypothetical protein [Mucilaginibacter phyllosphaerae]TEW63839.1 hypothetical protein E2R65_18920 [Mucilaginibacter phyllosphaerae]GGH22504.1 hypothetical protein GCM10007352_35840 [Mucilaginibacter phyllosphaerae]